MRVLLAYLMVIAIWTTTPLAISWSGEADWFFGVAARIGLSAVVILPLVFWFTDRRFSFAWSAIKVYASAAVGLLGGMTLIYWSAQTMPSGWIALIWGLNPIITGLLVHTMLIGHRLTPNKLIGIMVSLAGLILVFAPNLDAQQANIQLTGLLVAVLAAFFHSLSTVLVKKTNHDIPAIHVVAGALWITTVAYLIFNPSVLLNWPTLSLKSSLSIGYLVIIGSVLGFES